MSRSFMWDVRARPLTIDRIWNAMTQGEPVELLKKLAGQLGQRSRAEIEVILRQFDLPFVEPGQGCASGGSCPWMSATTARARSKSWRTWDSSGWEGSPGCVLRQRRGAAEVGLQFGID
jgi:hypothetical protein